MKSKIENTSLSLLMLSAVFIFFSIGGGSFELSAAHAIPCSGVLPRDRSKYLEDFEFIKKTVAENYPCLESKKIDWKSVAARFRPLFKGCESDEEHVRNIMRLLATLRDGHSYVFRSGVDRDLLPSKWDGLSGGGLWIAWDDGLLFLRGIVEGHPLEKTIPLGSVIAAIDGEPAWLALEREKRRITRWRGNSSDHSLFTSIGNCIFQFGDRQNLDILFITPALKTVKASLPRTGSGVKPFSPSRATLPDGVEWVKGAVSTFLESDVGYLRITGSMDFLTGAAFHRAMNRLRGLEALLLDCRSMGGGADKWAWAMQGVFSRTV